jgi:YggT family protein
MNPSGAFIYLISTLIDLMIVAILMRLLLQWVRADFYNPLCQFLVKITNPLVIPARRIIPSIGKLDTASVVVMIVLELIEVFVVNQIRNEGFSTYFLLLFTFKKLVFTLLITYFILIIARIIVSWIAQQSRHPLIPLIHQLTEPVLKPIKKFIPSISGIDLSPLIALITLRFLLLLLGW